MLGIYYLVLFYIALALCNTLCYTIRMRSIINISLPLELKKEVEREVKNGKYASVSEFFRAMLREWRRAEILRDIRQSQKEFAQGKGKVLRSLKDLR